MTTISEAQKEIVRHLIYGDIVEMPIHILSKVGLTLDDVTTHDTEQQIRLLAAASLLAWFENRLNKKGFLHDSKVHPEHERLVYDNPTTRAGE